MEQRQSKPRYRKCRIEFRRNNRNGHWPEIGQCIRAGRAVCGMDRRQRPWPMRGITQKRVHAENLGQSPGICGSEFATTNHQLQIRKTDCPVLALSTVVATIWKSRVLDVDDCLSHNSRCCSQCRRTGNVNSTKSAKSARCSLTEERRRFNDFALGAYSFRSWRPGNAALEESGTLGERLELVDMTFAAFDL